ncbi:MAG: universal stress protein [Spirosoma sp.]|nr:universal stress protein [Spirosoma sp.]
MKMIVVPTDLSAESEIALSVAVDLARVYESDIKLVHSVLYPAVVGPYPGGSMIVADYMLDTHRKLEDEARQTMDQMQQNPAYAGVSITPVLLTSGRGLVDGVTEQAADLIVLFSQGSSGLAEWLVGSNAEAITRHAQCPVLVIKKPISHFKPEKIVFAIDMDDRFRKSDHYPFQMGEQNQHQFLYVLTPSDNRQPDGIREWVDELAQYKGITDYNLVIRHAHSVPEGIVEYAEDTQADLIVLFTQGHTGLSHLLAGSVAEDVLNRAQTPVLIMRL